MDSIGFLLPLFVKNKQWREKAENIPPSKPFALNPLPFTSQKPIFAT